MKISFLSGGFAGAMGLLLTSFVSMKQADAGSAAGYRAGAQLVQDTVPRHTASGAKVNSGGSTSSREQGSTSQGQGSQNSDTRGDGTKKGRKSIGKERPDSTNSGAVNTPPTPGAQF